MKTNIEMHLAQFQILRFLLFHQKARFSDLNVLKLTTDHFTFHVSTLIKNGLVIKDEIGKYTLTTEGKSFANQLDTEGDGVEKQAKITTLIVCVEKDKYLIQQRLKQPYFGYYGFFGGKIKLGSTPEETAIRELKEETGLSAKKVLLKAVKHKMDYSENNQLLEDKYFFIFKAEGLYGELTNEFEGGKNLWLTKKEILKLPDLFDGVLKTLNVVESENFSYLEDKYLVKKF